MQGHVQTGHCWAHRSCSSWFGHDFFLITQWQKARVSCTSGCCNARCCAWGHHGSSSAHFKTAARTLQPLQGVLPCIYCKYGQWKEERDWTKGWEGVERKPEVYWEVMGCGWNDDIRSGRCRVAIVFSLELLQNPSLYVFCLSFCPDHLVYTFSRLRGLRQATLWALGKGGCEGLACGASETRFSSAPKAGRKLQKKKPNMPSIFLFN